MNEQDKYIIQGGEEGKKRLDTLSEVLYEHTKEFILRSGPIGGKHFLDVGTGGGNNALMAAEMVGAEGHVTAIDFDETIIRLARSDAEALHATNITYRTLNAYELDAKEKFDIAYARFLLCHLERPDDVLSRMVNSVVPGGRVIIEDIDFSGHFCHPGSGAFSSYVQLFSTAARNNGHDPDIGLRLSELFADAGLKGVTCDVIQPFFHHGPGKWMAYLTLDKIKETLVRQGLATPDRLDDLLLELKQFTENDRSIISLPRIFRFCGYKG